MARTEHPRPPQGANIERVRADQERRRSGAAGKHADRRTRRVRTRATARRAAITEGA